MTVIDPPVPSPSIIPTPPTEPATIPVFDLLPSELLVLILSFAVHLTNQGVIPVWDNWLEFRDRLRFPYTALLVSKRWNQIATAAPEVWNAVIIWTNEPIARMAWGLDLHWKRSGGLPLDLQITSNYYGLSKLLSILPFKFEMGMRWKSLQIEGYPTSIHDFIQELFSPSHTFPLADNAIEELQILCPSHDTEIPVTHQDPYIAGFFPNLRRLCYVRSQNLFTLPNIQSLCLDDVRPEKLSLFFRTQFLNLIALAIHCDPRDQQLPEESFIPSSFHQPTLQSAILYNLDTRNLTTLLSGAPHLQRLAISSVDLFWDTRCLMDVALAPEMSSLTIFSPWTLDSGVRDIVERRLPTVNRITLHEGAVLDAREDEELGEVMKWLEAHVILTLLPTNDLSFTYLSSGDML